MDLVKQPTTETCGQACIAMITGKPIEEVIRDMRTSGPTSIGQLIEILDRYGVKHADRNTRISKKNPSPYYNTYSYDKEGHRSAPLADQTAVCAW